MGRYIVKLPFKRANTTFATTLQGAVSRFDAVERRLLKNTQLQQQYVSFMQDYESLGHMRELTPDEIHTHQNQVFYMPHHPIVGQKLRVVFDLFNVCIRFRIHRFVFLADIVKMFRQIWVNEEHRNYQRILCRKNPFESVRHYQLCTVTYGTVCAPFLAVRVLEQLAHDYEQ